MRFAIAALVACVGLGGCQYIEYPSAGPDAGNPNHMAYAGGPGSVYDRAANPPSDIGRASYDAYSPINNLPADERLPPATMPAANPAMPAPANQPPLR